jgi:DNA repair exonuclease SbcCD ATPase subunit
MITHLALRNWKAYNQLDLDFQEGATFVIARNGIGKTSLVQGAMWALFGDSSGIDAASCVRSGSTETSAEVSVALGNELAQISRAYSADTGKTETAITVRGQTTMGTKAVERYLMEGLGAEPAILARMSFLREGEAVAAEASAAQDLRSHLSRVFGVDKLLILSGAEEQRRRRLTRVAQETRRMQRLAETARAELTARLGQLEANLGEFRQEQGAARATIRGAQKALASWTSWAVFEGARQRWVAERQAVLKDASRQLGIGETSETAVIAWLDSQRGAAQARLEELSREAGAVQTERRMLVDLASSLDTDVEACPVCLRPITPDERQHAERAHSDRIRGLGQRVTAISEQSRTTRARMVEIDRWIRELTTSAAGPQPPSSPQAESLGETSLAGAQEAVARATQTLEQVSAHVAQLEEEIRDVHEKLQTDAEAATRSAELFVHYREEALSELIAGTLKRAAEEIRARRIDPLATEIQNRWKLLWPTRAPLKLLPDGRLVATRAGRQIPYGEFSGGEKVISTIIVRLLALSMTTTTPFLWLDEPLEHLDPRNRRMVASLLVKASQGDRTTQVVATTYEEAVARRLDETQAAHLLYVEAEADGG